MARLVTLATLQTRVLQRAHLQTGSNVSAIAPAAEVIDNINEGIAEFHRIVVGIPGQPYYLESADFNTSSAVDTYAIGPGQAVDVDDFLDVKGFDVQFGANLVNTARPFMWSERNRFKLLYSGWIYTQPVFYRMLGKPSGQASAALDSVKFIPQPSGQFAITMWYTPTPTKLVAPTDTFDGINGYEELVVLSAAVKLLLKQEQFEHAQALMSERSRQETQMLSMLTHDSDAPERVTDVTLNDDGYIGRPIY